MTNNSASSASSSVAMTAVEPDPSLTLTPGGRLELLRQLSDAVAVSGDESEVRKLLRPLIEPLTSEVRIDAMGNLHAVRKGTGESTLRVALSAPMDETGFMVTDISDGGLISVLPVGSHDPRYLPTQRVLVGKKKQPGHFLWAPIHKSAGQKGLQRPADMQIDVGAASKGEVQAQPGERIAYASNFRALGDSVVRGKAFESRAACVAVIGLLAALQDQPLPFDLSIVFSAQAQIGARGMIAAAKALTPDVGIALCGVNATDLPPNLDRSDKTGMIRLGDGPALRLHEPNYIADRAMVQHVQATARAAQIPLQLHSQSGAGIADSMPLGAGPVASHAVTLALPIRYLGTPIGLLSLNDLEALIRLVRATLEALPGSSLENMP